MTSRIIKNIGNNVSEDPDHLVKVLGMKTRQISDILASPIPVYFLLSTNPDVLGGNVTLIKAFFDSKDLYRWRSKTPKIFGETANLGEAQVALEERYKITVCPLEKLVYGIADFGADLGIETRTLYAVIQRDFSFWTDDEKEENDLERQWKEEIGKV